MAFTNFVPGTVITSEFLNDIQDADFSNFTAAGVGAAVRTVSSKLGDSVHVKDFGAVGDGTTNDLAAINAAIDYVFDLGGGDVVFGPLVYGITGEVVLNSRVRLVGVPGATEIKFIGTTDAQVISHPYRTTGNFLEDAGMYGIICNSNRAVQPQVVATSCATFDPCKRLRIEKCIFKGATGYGFGLQSGPGLSDTNESEDVTLIDVILDDNGFGPGAFDGLDVKSVKRMTMLNVTSKNNAGDGLDFRGEDVVLINCKAHNNAASGLEISASVNGSAQNSSITVLGGSFYSNTVAGARMASGASGTGLCRVSIHGGSYYSNTSDGIVAINSGDRVRASIDGAHTYSNGGHGVACMASHQMFHLSNVEAFNNTGSGVYAVADNSVRMVNVRARLNTRYGYEEATNSNRNAIGSGCLFLDNTIGSVLLGTNLRVHVARDFSDYVIGVAGGDIIASAATITLPFGGDTFAVTGTTNILTINGGFRNRQVTLFLGSGITIEHSTGNIRLASGTNITTTASRSTLTLAYDGGLWRQVSYSSVP